MSKTWKTELVRKLGMSYPLILAPMNGAGTPELVAAVTNAGGLGSLAASYASAPGILSAVESIRAKTTGTFNINLFVQDTPRPGSDELQRGFALLDPICEELGLPPAAPLEKYCEDFREQLEMVIELKVPVASFTFGLLDAESVERLHRAGSMVVGTATNVAEARAWEENGADIICAQGAEAGGHRGTFIGKWESSMIGTMALVPQIVDNVRLPVIAAGGIMDGRGAAAALVLGAQAAQLGTAFLPCAESKIPPAWKERVRQATDTSTRPTRTFTGRAARAIVNEYMQKMEPYEEQVPEFPVQNALTTSIRQAAAKADHAEFLSMWAGQAAAMARGRKESIGASELMQQLVAELRTALDA